MTYKQIAQIMWIFFPLMTMLFGVNKGLAAPSESRQAIVVFIDGFSFKDVDNLRNRPQMQSLFQSASHGAMSIRTPGARTAENAYLLMGSGGQAVYTMPSDTGYAPDEQLTSGERAWERMQQISGQARDGQQKPAILFPGIQRLLTDNQKRSYTERIGLLGSMLKENRMRVTLLGNADYGSVKQRSAALFTMDRQGEIADGDVTAATLVRAAQYPFGVRTDYEGLVKRVENLHDSGLTVIELGDLARLYRLQPMMSLERFDLQYKRVITDLERFVAKLVEQRTTNQLIMVASSGVNPDAQKAKSLLLPILMWHGSDIGDGLFSYTTRQDGLVSGLDVLPTLLNWFGIELPDYLAGHVMKEMEEPPGFSYDRLLAKVEWIDHIYRNRSSVLSGYVFMQIIALLVALGIWIWQRRRREQVAEGVKRPVRIVLFSLLFYPGLFLLEPLLPWRLPPVLVLALCFFLSMLLASALEKRDFVKSLFLVAAFTAGFMLLDGFLGGQAMSRSYLGHDPVIGARFYGMGNELEGVLIGSSILLAATVYEGIGEQWRWRRLLVYLYFAIVLVYMALPSLGANAGGFLAGAIGFGVTLMCFHGLTMKKRELLIISGILACGIGVLIMVNLWSNQPYTHVGKVAQQIVSGDWSAVGQIVERKLAMNIKLIRVSLWSKGFVVSLIALGVLTFCSGRFMRHFAQKWPFLIGGFRGIVAGSLAGLVLNDSGIISAATSIIFFAIPALYAALDDRGLPADRST